MAFISLMERRNAASAVANRTRLRTKPTAGALMRWRVLATARNCARVVTPASITYDRAVSGAHKMLSFLGGGERRGISENDLAPGGFASLVNW